MELLDLVLEYQQTGNGLEEILEATFRHRQIAARKARYACPEWVDYDDLIQQSVIALIYALRKYRPMPESTVDWYLAKSVTLALRRFANRIAGRRAKKESDKPYAIETSVEEVPDAATHDPDVALWLVAADAPDWPLARAITIEGHSLTSAAEILGISKSTAHDRYHRALFWLTGELDDRLVADPPCSLPLRRRGSRSGSGPKPRRPSARS